MNLLLHDSIDDVKAIIIQSSLKGCIQQQGLSLPLGEIILYDKIATATNFYRNMSLLLSQFYPNKIILKEED